MRSGNGFGTLPWNAAYAICECDWEVPEIISKIPLARPRTPRNAVCRLAFRCQEENPARSPPESFGRKELPAAGHPLISTEPKLRPADRRRSGLNKGVRSCPRIQATYASRCRYGK